MEIRIYNTLTRRKETFTPLDEKRVRMFVCGPTVYDLSHIGHARTYIAFDVIAKILRKFDVPLSYVVNITDIDDKIIARANETKRGFDEVAQEFEASFLNDMKRLGIDSIDTYARASEFIAAIIKQIEVLEEKGFAYKTSSGVYFRVKKFKEYGKLSNQNMDEIKAGARVETDEEKEDPTDFVLWKAAKPDEPKWPSPWGEGRPGWHIEDTAITHSIFGPQYDLHGGALDLIFPHHESEIAQNEAAYNVDPFVNVWMHTGYLNIRGEKMSKSLKNFITIREMLKTTDPHVFRLFIISAHYRSPIDFDDELVDQAKASLARIIGFRDRLERLTNDKQLTTNDGDNESGPPTGSDPQPTTSERGSTESGPPQRGEPRSTTASGAVVERVQEAQAAFDAALADDFDTPGALAVVFNLIRDVNPLIEDEKISEQERNHLLGFLQEMDGVFGILPSKQKAAPKPIRKLAERREELRKERKFDEADTVRDQILVMGWEVEDTEQGPRLIKRG